MPSSYGSMTSITINLDGLVGGAVAASTVVDNSATMFDAVQVYLKITPGTLRDAAFVLVGLMASSDNITFADTFATEVKISTSLQANVANVHFLTLNNLPPFFKIYVHNRTGSPFSSNAGSNSLSYCPIKN